LKWLRFLAFPLFLLGGVAAAGAFVAGLVVALAYPSLPSLEVLTDYQPKIPLRIYTVEGALIGEFGEERVRDVRHDQADHVRAAAAEAARVRIGPVLERGDGLVDARDCIVGERYRVIEVTGHSRR
jgi:hypothetical protein